MSKLKQRILHAMAVWLCSDMARRMYAGGANQAEMDKVFRAVGVNQYKNGKGFLLKLRLFMYRHLRSHIVNRLKATGASWTFINRVLRGFEQEQVVCVTRYANGDVIEFAKRAKRKEIVIKDGMMPHVKTTEVTPKVVDFRTKAVKAN